MREVIGYARTSTADQCAGFDAQKRDLLVAGCTRIYAEQVSSMAEREQLNLALAAAGNGDTIVVCKPDRLARSTLALLEIVRDLDAKGVSLIILSMGGQRLDTRNPTSKLVLTILAGVATWEREIMLERQREGIAKARTDGKYKGRKPTQRHKADSVWRMSDEKIPQKEIARALKLSVPTVKAYVKARKLNGFSGFSPSGFILADNDPEGERAAF